MHFFQRLDGRPQREFAAQQCAAESFAADFNLFGQRDLLLARQQRDAGHLREVHPDRVAVQLAQFFQRKQGRLFSRFGSWFHRRFERITGCRIEQVDAFFFQRPAADCPAFRG